MRSPLADRLRRHALTLVDPSVRAALYRTIAAEVDDDELREAVVSLTAASAQGDVGARVAFQSLLIALSAAPERQRAVFAPEAMAATGSDDEEEHRVPDYGRGRPLTLGERKSLARKPDRRMFDRVLRDPHPDVIALLLQNSHLTEVDVVRLCARRPGIPEVLSRVAASPKWSLRPAVRRALAMNPATPAAIAAGLLPLLAPEDLRALIDDERTPPTVARRCEELLARDDWDEDDGSLSDGT
jgi:hypothetical protein